MYVANLHAMVLGYLKLSCSRLLSIVIECGLRVLNCYALILCMMKESRRPISTNYEPPPYEPLLYKSARKGLTSFIFVMVEW